MFIVPKFNHVFVFLLTFAFKCVQMKLAVLLLTCLVGLSYQQMYAPWFMPYHQRSPFYPNYYHNPFYNGYPVRSFYVEVLASSCHCTDVFCSCVLLCLVGCFGFGQRRRSSPNCAISGQNSNCKRWSGILQRKTLQPRCWHSTDIQSPYVDSLLDDFGNGAQCF